MKPKEVYSIKNKEGKLLEANIIQTHKDLYVIGEIMDKGVNIHCFPVSMDLINKQLEILGLSSCELVKA